MFANFEYKQIKYKHLNKIICFIEQIRISEIIFPSIMLNSLVKYTLSLLNILAQLLL